MIPAFIAKDSVRSECRKVYWAGVYFAVLFGASAGCLLWMHFDSLAAAMVALSGVCAGVAIGADSIERGTR